MVGPNSDESTMSNKSQQFKLRQMGWLIPAGLLPPKPELSEDGHVFADVFVKSILCERITRVEKILKFFDSQFTVDQITNVMGVTGTYVRRVLIENYRIRSRSRGEKIAVNLFNADGNLIKKYDSITKLSKQLGITVYKILNAIDRSDGFLMDGLFVKVNEE